MKNIIKSFEDLRSGMVGVFEDNFGRKYCGVLIGNTFINKHGGVTVDRLFVEKYGELRLNENRIKYIHRFVKIIRPLKHLMENDEGYLADLNFWFDDAQFLDYDYQVLWQSDWKIYSLKKFLQNKCIWNEFLENCKVENQRWSEADRYYEKFEPDEIDKHNWISCAFNIELPERKEWKDINDEWYEVCHADEYDVINFK